MLSMTDRKGAIYEGREGLNPIKEEMAKITNANQEKGSLSEVIKGADVFIGVSASWNPYSGYGSHYGERSDHLCRAQTRLQRFSRMKRKRQQEQQ